MSPTILDEPPHELEAVRAGLLPTRYGYRLQDVFLERLAPLLQPGATILDVGSGRSPTIARGRRPPGCRYVGLDISEEELRHAAPGDYDETIAQDITRPLARDREFDVVISWQVLEHVRPLGLALESIHAALRPGGVLLAQLSGSFAAFALLSRVVPHRIRVSAMARLLGHAEEEKFPTHYDGCYASALERMLEPWATVTLRAYYRGAIYFNMSRPLQRAYLAYESLLASRDVRNLATHYLVTATR